MTVISDDRSKLDAALANTRLTLFLISGAGTSAAQAIHDEAEGILESWQRVFWIQDLSILAQSERDAWFAMEGRYAVVARKSREVVAKGEHADLLLVSGEPSTIEIAEAINKGDL